MARRVRAYPWDRTALGPMEGWPEGLRAVVALVLASPAVSSLAIGPDRLLIYNDAAARLYGDRHPGALGRPLAETSAGDDPAVAALYDQVFAGEAVQCRAQPLALGAGGREAFDVCLTPVSDPAGHVLAAHMTGFERGARKRAQAAVWESERKFRTLFDTMGLGYALVELVRDASGRAIDHRYVEFNPAIERLLGVPAAEALGRRASEIFPDIEPWWTETFDRVVRRGEPETIEHFFAPLGRWFEVYACPAGGDCFITLCVDITERKRAEAALRASEKERGSLISQMNEGFCILEVILDEAGRGRDYRFLETNAAFLRQGGFDPAGRLMSEIAPIEPVWPAAYGRVAVTGVPERIVDTAAAFNRTYEAYAFRVGAAQDRRVAVFFTDVTAAREAEQRLRAGEARQRALVEGIPQLVWRAVDGGHWTWASPQWTEFTGQAEADSHGQGWLDPVHPADRARLQEVWAGAVERGEFHADYRIRRVEDGRYHWFQTRASPVRGEAGEIVEWLGTSTDVEDLRSLQERQRVLLHELQHRVRNILSVVRSLSQSTAATSDTVDDFAAHFDGRLNSLARTQMVLTRSPGGGVDLEAMVREELLAQAPNKDQIEVEGPEVLLSAKAAEVLALAVHELATNAVKYGALSTAAGTVAIHWTVSREKGEDWLRFSWSEKGVRVLAPAPRRDGFGTELVTMRVPYELRGHGSLELRAGGAKATISFPMRPGESILQTDAPGA